MNCNRPEITANWIRRCHGALFAFPLKEKSKVLKEPEMFSSSRSFRFFLAIIPCNNQWKMNRIWSHDTVDGRNPAPLGMQKPCKERDKLPTNSISIVAGAT